MNYEMKMPDLATTGSAVKILRWLKEPGQAVQRGEFILEIETDKAVMEVEASVDGTLREIKAGAGAEAAAGEVIALLEIAKAGAPSAPSVTAPSTPAAPPAGPAPAAATPAHRPTGMFARNRDAAARAVPASSPPSTPGTAEDLSPARRTAARRLQESKQSIPHFYLQASAGAEALIARRGAAADPKPVWDAYFVSAVSRALRHFDRMNYRYADERLVPQNTTSIGVAADVAGELFVVPVEAPADKGIGQISAEIRAGVEALRSGDPASRRIQPGVMTISNLGGTGIEGFTAIINPPEAAILAVGAIRPVVVPRGTGFAAEPRVSLTLSVDHRVVNGKYAAEFLAAIVKEIEAPAP